MRAQQVVVDVVATSSLLLGCNTDQPKSAGTDAGSAVDVTAPSSQPAALTADAGTVTAHTGTATDAGPIPVVSAQVDAGHMGDGNNAKPQIDGHAPINGINPDLPLKQQVFNRLLVKPTNKDLATAEQVTAFVEAKTGQKLEKVRKTAGTFWLLQFAPVVPARDKAKQDALMAKLKDTKAFAVVEPDQVMQLKTP